MASFCTRCYKNMANKLVKNVSGLMYNSSKVRGWEHEGHAVCSEELFNYLHATFPRGFEEVTGQRADEIVAATVISSASVAAVLVPNDWISKEGGLGGAPLAGVVPPATRFSGVCVPTVVETGALTDGPKTKAMEEDGEKPAPVDSDGADNGIQDSAETETLLLGEHGDGA